MFPDGHGGLLWTVQSDQKCLSLEQWDQMQRGSERQVDEEFVFFGMIVVPVYMFSALLDGFIFNSIQF
jgi:hypothetical protein